MRQRVDHGRQKPMSVITDRLAQARRLRSGGQENETGKTMDELRDTIPRRRGNGWTPSEGVIEVEGQDRAAFLLDELLSRARRRGTPVPYSAATPYLTPGVARALRCA
jgi:hypothetical protein